MNAQCLVFEKRKPGLGIFSSGSSKTSLATGSGFSEEREEWTRKGALWTLKR